MKTEEIKKKIDVMINDYDHKIANINGLLVFETDKQGIERANKLISLLQTVIVDLLLIKRMLNQLD